MPPKKALRPPPSSELHEPYERYLYADLRHELSVRHIRIPRSGQCLNTRVGFIQLLRDWDEAQTQTPETPRRTSPRRKNQTQMTSTRVIRARRGCRFRLINALLSPEFNRRWNEMVSRGGKMEVNRFWLDVHAAFLAQNSALDALHFQDALFVNVTPNVILGHSAARLLQMWIEIVAMYRNAVAQAKEAASHNDNVHSFFDFCAGRLDLLYLHMAMLLEPKLYDFVMSDKLSGAEPFSKSKAKTKAVAAATVSTKATAAGGGSKPGAAIKAAAAKVKATGPIPAAKTAVAPTPAPTKAAVTTPATQSKPSGVLMQNPEMKEPLSPAMAKSSSTKTATPKVNKPSVKAKAKPTKPAASPQKPLAPKKVQKAAGKGKAPTTAATGSLAKETKPKAPVTVELTIEMKAKAPVTAASAEETELKASSSKQKPSVPQAKQQAASKLVVKKSLVGDKPAQKTSHGKRPREEEDSSVVEVPAVSDIVPHSGNKRVHTTTTISTALATRPTDMVLPPDEWDILESRLRKVNENIDRCHRGLSSVEGNVSDSYKQSLEADLRFYSAIKQRLQEQLLVVMQSGY